MKVKDLIEQLQDLNQEAEVHFAYNYGDYWRTTVAPVASDVSEGVVKYSEYHSMDKLVGDEDDVYDEETGDLKEGSRQVVIIS